MPAGGVAAQDQRLLDPAGGPVVGAGRVEDGYGSARQLTLFQNGLPILQVLTSDLTATGASLLCWLRARWRIENMFKYAVEHNGIDRLTDYVMDLGTDTPKVT